MMIESAVLGLFIHLIGALYTIGCLVAEDEETREMRLINYILWGLIFWPFTLGYVTEQRSQKLNKMAIKYFRSVE